MTDQAHGFASLNGGTTGGAGGNSVTVSTGKELMAAIDSAGSKPLTIYVDGTITTANTGADVIALADAHDISIIGVGSKGEFDGIGIRVSDASSNLIIQNLSIHNVHAGPGDAIGIEGGSHNIWIDHNELYDSMSANKDYYDGLIDIKRGSQYVTVSYNDIHDHHKVSLDGYSDSDTGSRYITYDHNMFENIGSRAPSVRDGYVHVYDNYYKDVEVSGINLRMGAVGLIENNVFEDSHNPIVSIDSAKIGYWDLRNNEFDNVTWSKVGSNEASAQNGKSTAHYDVPYKYELDATSTVKADVLAHAGVGKLGLSTGGGGTVVTPPKDTSPTTGGDDGSSGSGGSNSGGTTPDTQATSKNDNLAGTSGADVINGLGGKDIILGNGGNDKLNGGTGDDQLDGGTGNDTLAGDAGNDLLQGGAGNDKLSGGAGSDKLNGDSGSDTLLGEDGNDTLQGGIGNDTLNGGDGKDTLDGGDGNDILLGGEGKDTVKGGEGADRLTGGLDADKLSGGNGADIFIYTSLADSKAGSGRDTILDFGAGDKIDLSALDARSDVSGNQAFTFIGSKDFSDKSGQLHVVESSSKTMIEADLNGDGKADFQIELTGLHSLAASDFAL